MASIRAKHAAATAMRGLFMIDHPLHENAQVGFINASA
jgi:hypothetical protein